MTRIRAGLPMDLTWSAVTSCSTTPWRSWHCRGAKTPRCFKRLSRSTTSIFPHPTTRSRLEIFRCSESRTGRCFATLGILLAAAMLAWSRSQTTHLKFAAKCFALLLVLSVGAGLAGCGVVASSSPPADAATGTAPGNYALSVSSMTGSGTQATTVMITIVKE